MFDIPCIIFAGGKSSRMGEDKALLPFGGFDTLTQYQYFRLSKFFSHIYISCKDKSKFNFQANFIEDIKTNDIFAPTAGFITSYQKLQTDSFFVLSVDTPFIDEQHIKRIIDADKKNADATIATTNSNIQPMCGIYHRSLESNFLKMLKNNNHKLNFLLKNSNTIFVDFSDEKPFLNLNHPNQYKEALLLLSLNYH